LLKLSNGQDTIFKTLSLLSSFKIDSILFLYLQDILKTILTKVKILCEDTFSETLLTQKFDHATDNANYFCSLVNLFASAKPLLPENNATV